MCLLRAAAARMRMCQKKTSLECALEHEMQATDGCMLATGSVAHGERKMEGLTRCPQHLVPGVPLRA